MVEKLIGGDPSRPGAPVVDAPAPVRPRLGDGLTVWLTGLPSAGKTTIANGLAARLADEGYPVEILDGDAVRQVLGPELGFTREDRDRNVRRVGYVAELLSRHGVVVVCALVSPYRSTRDEVRAAHGGRFFEVLVAAPTSVCAERDVKGLYACQSAGDMMRPHRRRRPLRATATTPSWWSPPTPRPWPSRSRPSGTSLPR